MTTRTAFLQPPVLLLRLVLLLAAATLLWALAGLVAGLVLQNYFLAGLEGVLAACCVVGVFTGLGRHNSGPAVAIASLAGAVGTCSVLGALSSGGVVMGVSVKLLLAGRLGVAAALLAIAGLVMLLRRPGVSAALLLKGALLGGPAVAAIGAYVFVAPLRAALHALHPVALAFVGSIAFLVLLGLLSLGAHCVIRAFETGLEAAQETPPGPRAESA